MIRDRHNYLCASFGDNGRTIAVAGTVDGMAMDGMFDRVEWAEDCKRYVQQDGTTRSFRLPSHVRVHIDRADPQRRVILIGAVAYPSAEPVS